MEVTSTWVFDKHGNAIHRVLFSPVYGCTVLVVSHPLMPKHIDRSCVYVRYL